MNLCFKKNKLKRVIYVIPLQLTVVTGYFHTLYIILCYLVSYNLLRYRTVLESKLIEINFDIN